MSPARRLLADALSLSEAERLDLAAELLASVPAPALIADDDPGFVDEMKKRAEEARADPSGGIEWLELREKLRRE